MRDEARVGRGEGRVVGAQEAGISADTSGFSKYSNAKFVNQMDGTIDIPTCVLIPFFVFVTNCATPEICWENSP